MVKSDLLLIINLINYTFFTKENVTKSRAKKLLYLLTFFTKNATNNLNLTYWLLIMTTK